MLKINACLDRNNLADMLKRNHYCISSQFRNHNFLLYHLLRHHGSKGVILYDMLFGV